MRKSGELNPWMRSFCSRKYRLNSAAWPPAPDTKEQGEGYFTYIVLNPLTSVRIPVTPFVLRGACSITRVDCVENRESAGALGELGGGAQRA